MHIASNYHYMVASVAMTAYKRPWRSNLGSGLNSKPYLGSGLNPKTLITYSPMYFIWPLTVTIQFSIHTIFLYSFPIGFLP